MVTYTRGFHTAVSKYGGKWQTVRKKILARDGYVCQIRAKGCQGQATDVDHIVPPSLGGSWYDWANLRAACHHCNAGRLVGRGETWRLAPTNVHLVVGAGLGAWVADKARPGDLVVDYETIAHSVGGNHEAVNAARNILLQKIRGGQLGVPAVWITSSNPKAEDLFPYHQVHVVDPGIDACDPAMRGLAERWYAERGESTASAPSRAW